MEQGNASTVQSFRAELLPAVAQGCGATLECTTARAEHHQELPEGKAQPSCVPRAACAPSEPGHIPARLLPAGAVCAGAADIHSASSWFF